MSTGQTEASAATVKTEVRKLEFLRGLDTHILDLSTLPVNAADTWPQSGDAARCRR